jgi:hypothetical protein
MKRKAFTFILVFVLFLIGIVFYMFYKPHRSAEGEKAAFKLSAVQLFNEYSDNEAASNNKYLDKVLEVEGTISEILHDKNKSTVFVLKEEDDIFGIVCTLYMEDEETKNAATAIRLGDKIILKGICVGYDMDVKMNKCVIVDIAK